MLLLALLFLVFSFFFTASEMAFVASNKIIVLIRSKNNKTYKILDTLLKNPKIYLYTVLVGTNLCIVLMTNILEGVFISDSDVGSSFLLSLILAFVILIVSEVIPKSITKVHPEKFALIASPIIRVFYYIFYPFIIISTTFSEILFRIFKFNNNEHKIQISKSDLYYYVKGHVYAKKEIEEETKLIRGIFEFKDKQANEIMTPRMEIFSVNENADFKEIKKALMEEGKVYTRIPVYSNSQDFIIGILNINDLILNRDKSVKELMLKPFFAPESIMLDRLLADMKERNEHIAILVNEYGGLAGLVSIEDIIEELLGDISDEYDTDKDEVSIKRGQIIVEGEMSINDINELIESALPESEIYETIAGYILYKLGHLPKVGDKIIMNNITLTVLTMDENKIEKVIIEKGKSNEITK